MGCGSRMRNLRLTLSYDGTNYHGFQRQPEFHGPTIQGTLEKVWKDLVGEEIHIYTAGRTDTGVHAAGQVINFMSESRIPQEKIPKAFNSLLPRDIRILAAKEEREDFHARMSAKWKRYDYLIDNRLIPDVFQRLYALHEPISLNVEAMQQASLLLAGRHNFHAFASAGGSSKTFERTLYICRVVKVTNKENKNPFEIQGRKIQGRELLKITCIGDGFLYNMVRIITGTLLEVGRGRITPEDIPEIIRKQDRKKAGETAPAHGLTLTYVHYDEGEPKSIYPEFD